MIHLKLLEKQEQANPKLADGKKNIRAEINKRIQRINETKLVLLKDK
jgi:hypothetical protein